MAEPCIVLSDRGSELVEVPFVANEELIGTVVHQALPMLVHEPKIRVFNRECAQPRDVGFFSDESKGYFYSNTVMPAQPLTEEMRALMTLVNNVFGAEFNGVLINRYRDGTKTVGEHSDSEAGLDPRAGVVALSWGASRTFRVRRRAPSSAPRPPVLLDYATRHAYALQMRGNFQRELTHEIPKQSRVTEERVSLTLRRHVAAEEARLFAALEKRSARKRQRSDSLT